MGGSLETSYVDYHTVEHPELPLHNLRHVGSCEDVPGVYFCLERCEGSVCLLSGHLRQGLMQVI